MKKTLLLIGLGIFNALHALIHLFQFAQSMVLLHTSLNAPDNETGIDKLLHNPIFSIIWAIIGIMTIYIGIKDFKHHHKHKD